MQPSPVLSHYIHRAPPAQTWCTGKHLPHSGRVAEFTAVSTCTPRSFHRVQYAFLLERNWLNRPGSGRCAKIRRGAFTRVVKASGFSERPCTLSAPSTCANWQNKPVCERSHNRIDGPAKLKCMLLMVNELYMQNDALKIIEYAQKTVCG